MAKDWDPREDQQLEKLYIKDRAPIEKISKKMDRSISAIRNRLNRIKVGRTKPSYITHFRCPKHKWILKKKCIEKSRYTYCPHCDRIVRTRPRNARDRRKYIDAGMWLDIG